HSTPGSEMASRSETHTRVLVTTILLAVVTVTVAAPTPDMGWRAYQKRDYPAARADFEQRARDGDRVAQFNLAMMLMRGEAGATDVAGGLTWRRRSADAGLGQAQDNLGLVDENGAGDGRALTAAQLWWGTDAQQAQ